MDRWLMLTVRKVVQKAETALRSFDETPNSRVPDDHASANFEGCNASLH